MNDEPVMGAEVITDVEGQMYVGSIKPDESGGVYALSSGATEGIAVIEGDSAAESIHCAEACRENANIASRIIMDTSVDVLATYGEERAPTGLGVYYEHVLLGYDTYLCAGKAVNGNVSAVDNIYNHVLEGYLGAYHNGGDPDDGYPIVVSDNAVKVTTTIQVTTPEHSSGNHGENATPESEGNINLGEDETMYFLPDEITVVNYLDIVDCNFTRQIRPSSQLVDVMEDADYYLTLDSGYYLLLAEDIEDNKYVAGKAMQFPFDIYYEGIYYQTDASGYTEWIEINAPDNYRNVWDEGVNIADYESNNHWYVTPVYIPSWSEETDSEGALKYIRVKVTNKIGGELISSVSVQLSGVLYGFTITGINDISQYYKLIEADAGNSINFNAAAKKLEWRVGTRNRVGGTYLRYLVDGTLVDRAESYQTLPIRKGSGDGSNMSKTGDGEMSAGTSFSFIIKSIAGLTGENDYMEIIPHFKYLMPDGTIIDEESLLILYEYLSDTKWYVAGSNKEKEIFNEVSEYYEKQGAGLSNETVSYLNLERFSESYYDAADIMLHRYGDWIKYTLEQYNGRLSVSERIDIYEFMNRKYLTNFLGIAKIPSGLRLYSGEFEQLKVNLGNEPDEVITCEDYNSDGMIDIGYNTDRFRQSMQTWYGNYTVNQNIYIVNKRLYPEFWVDGNPVRPEADERIMRDGKLIIGFEIIAYKNGMKHLTYGDMWKVEGQKRYTVKEYITDTDNINSKDPDFQYDKILYDSLMIDYGDVAVVDVNDKLSDDYWNSGSFVIN